MAEYAVLVAGELLILTQQKKPKTKLWKREVNLEHQMPASKNKVYACNACELLEAYYAGNMAYVNRILDWFMWAVQAPFMQGEELTREEVYRGLPIDGIYVAAAIARQVGRLDVLALCMSYLRADLTWLLYGAGAGPGRKVVKHPQDRKNGVVIIGDGPLLSDLPYITSAGMRSVIFDRKSKTFMYVNAYSLTIRVALAVGLNIKKPYAKRNPREIAQFNATRALSPGLLPYGFSAEDQLVARTYLSNPTDPALALRLLPWIQYHVPGLDGDYVRWADGTVMDWFWEGHGSSTDMGPIDSWWPGGKTMKATADDGDRDESPGQRCVELSDRVTCQLDSGGPLQFILKPTHVDEVWRLKRENGRAWLMVGGVKKVAGTAGALPPIAETTTVPTEKCREHFWQIWLPKC